ncbi:GNAT family N-acetyltransferase [Algibacter miyuki]|uniref:GNAT family N-acetyltransferase n=1 Tax=Algibacter miyuki TaxID=1306933 RepID=A0ABV5H1H4_9FLAO|nr:GNAT family N-acetyltransferase [Algibacter miyuki]MDN3666364.1 GNAT family N-acetyltransferase [Algibacter miyuki]
MLLKTRLKVIRRKNRSPKMNIVRTNSENKDFIDLAKQLDIYLAEKDGEDHAFYAQFNKADTIKHVVIAYQDNQPLGCGAIKAYNNSVMEIKRMYTAPQRRGKGIASILLAELEQWTSELSYKKCILETGIKQTEAIGLYKKNGYDIIPNYGQYTNITDSTCFEKTLQ